MFDSNFLTFAGFAALLVLSPGPTWAVVTDGAIEGGLHGGLWTVAGIGTANFSLATASAFGLSAVFHQYPQALHVLAVCGALYMAWLGLRALKRATGPRRTQNENDEGSTRNAKGGTAKEVNETVDATTQNAKPTTPTRPGEAAAPALARFGLGLMTNLTNVSVVLFYTVVVPQFIGTHGNVLGRYLLLAQTHVAMSIAWMAAIAFFVGTLADRMSRPNVRRTMDVLTGIALLAFAAKIALSA